MNREVNIREVEERSDEGPAFHAWLDEAEGSECSKSLDRILKDRNDIQGGDVDAFKRRLFTSIYKDVGQDIKLAQDLEAALIFKNSKFEWWQVLLLSFLTLGIFYLVRPPDDDSIMVLTRSGRVLTLKIERESFMNKNAFEIIVLFAKYSFIMLFIVCIPCIIIWFLLSSKAMLAKLGLNDFQRDYIDAQMLEHLRRHYIIAAEVVGVMAICLFVYIWSKCPSDYGNRYRESYESNNVSAAQFVMRGAWKREVMMRLYFGKYPAQEMLDMHGGNASGGSVVHTIPVKDLAATGGTGGGAKDAHRLRAPPSPMNPTIIMMLSAITMLDTGLSWYQRAQNALKMVGTAEFCRQQPAAQGSHEAREYCTKHGCREWAKEHGLDQKFCQAIHYQTADSPDAIATCKFYNFDSPPCCTGCGMGQAMVALKTSGWLSILQEAAAILSDVGTLIFSFMAAASVATVATAVDHFDVRMRRQRWAPGIDVASNFDLAMPTASNFFDAVFDKAVEPIPEQHFQPVRRDPGSKVGLITAMFGSSLPTADEARQQEEALLAAGGGDRADAAVAGVSNWTKDEESRDWEEFVEKKQLATRVADADQWFAYQVTVPMKCLGITDMEKDPTDPRAERILAAWSEKPTMPWSALAMPMVAAGLLMFLLIIDPEDLSDKPIVLPHMPVNPLTKAFSAMVICMSIVAIGALHQYLVRVLNGTEHAVIVTDQRLFSVRFRPACKWLLNFGVYLRVDVFRHERDVWYGRVDSKHLSITQRILGSSVNPGRVFMQTRYGVLKLTRQWGNVFNVFNVVTQLSSHKSAQFLKKGEDNADTAWTWDTTAQLAEDGVDMLNKRGEIVVDEREEHLAGVRLFKKQKADIVPCPPSLYLVTKRGEDGTIMEEEKLVFHWTFTAAGALTHPFDTRTDLLLTSGRVFLWRRSNNKTFNCKTACLHGPLGWANALFRANSESNTISFFIMPKLLSFASATTITPPSWSNPLRPPINIPAVETCCAWLSSLISGEEPTEKDTSLVPERTAPLVTLWMMFRLVSSPQQADLMACVSPIAHRDLQDSDLLSAMGCQWRAKDEEAEPSENTDCVKLRRLRAIIGVVQDKVDS